MEYYRISDFAKKVGKHTNTVDNWFKALEEKRLHYVNRVSDEKVYDELDLRIAEFIRMKRDEKWALEGIFNALPDEVELRPFPLSETTNVPQVADMDTILREIRVVAEQIAAAQVAEVKQLYADLMRRLPEPENPLEEKQKRVSDLITQRRVIAELESEALDMWYTKPKEERFRSVGWFRKEENIEFKERFIRSYVNERLGTRLKQEYGLIDSTTSGPQTTNGLQTE